MTRWLFACFALVFFAGIIWRLSWLPQYVSISFRGRIKMELAPDWRERLVIEIIPIALFTVGILISLIPFWAPLFAP